MQDEALIATWLHGRPATTQRAYRRHLSTLRANLEKPELLSVNLTDLQRYFDRIAGQAPRSQAQAMAAIKSFFAFHLKCGAIAVDPTAGLQPIKVPQDLAERILEEGDIPKLVSAARPGRDHGALQLLYGAGLRAAELCSLYWRQLAPRGEGGQVTVTGKGGKTRAVLLTPELWRELVDLKVNPSDLASQDGAAAEDSRRAFASHSPSDPVFPSDKDPSRPMGQRQLLRIVKRAAAAAGLTGKLSSHWLRHSHASHALDHGAPIQLVRDTLGHASIATTNKYAHARPNASSASYLPNSRRE